MVQIRLLGLPEKVQEVTKQIEEQFFIERKSEDYPNRGSSDIRIYINVERWKVKYPSWSEVPDDLKNKTWFKKNNLVLPKEPVAQVKNGTWIDLYDSTGAASKKRSSKPLN